MEQGRRPGSSRAHEAPGGGGPAAQHCEQHEGAPGVLVMDAGPCSIERWFGLWGREVGGGELSGGIIAMRQTRF